MSTKKILCGLLSLLLVLSLIPTNFTLVASASTSDVTLNVYEVSYLNHIGVNGTPFKTADIADENFKEGKNFITSNFISKSYTFYSLDGKYCITGVSSAGSFTLTGFSYQGTELDVNLDIPDTIVFHFLKSADEVKIGGDGDDKNEFSHYEVTTGALSCTVTSISTAFNGDNMNQSLCTSISLSVPKRVTTIDRNAFLNNTKLVAIDFEGDIQSIGTSAFEGCTRLKTLDLAGVFDTVATNTIPDKCFYKCSSLENISIPSTILNIGKESFYQCDKIDYLLLSDSMKTIGKNAFAMCSNLRYLYIESDYSDWSEIVSSNERYKLITETANEAPLVALAGATTPIQNYIYGTSKVVITSKVDLDLDSVKVTKDGVSVPVSDYTDSTYGYKTKAASFQITQNDKGTYVVSGKDILGNEVNSTFKYISDVVDTKAPVVEITGVGQNENYQSVSIRYRDDETYVASVMFDGKEVTATGYLECSTEGQHTLVVKDIFGNTTTKTFVIDVTVPTLSGIENGKSYDVEKELIISDGGSGVKSITVNDKLYSLTDKIMFTTTGTYTVVVTDNALNTTTCKFIIDTVGPSLNGVESKKLYNSDVKCVAVSEVGIKAISVSFKATDGATSKYNIKSGDSLTADGTYTITVEDLLDNSTKYTVIIDKTAPTITGVSNGGYYNSEVSGTITDTNLDTATLNGKKANKSFNAKDNGFYTIIANDKAGNSSTVSFTVDTIAPKVTGVSKGKKYTKAVTISVSDSSPIKNIVLNGKVITNKYKVSKSGSYKLVVEDMAGNITSFSFKVDTKAPTVSFKNYGYYRKSVKVTVKDDFSGVASIILDGNTVSNKVNVKKEGIHKVTVKDKYGNSKTYKFKIDKTKPVCTTIKNKAVVKKGTRIKVTDKVAGVKSLTLNKKKIKNNYKLTKKGKYTLTMIDKAGNTRTIKFTVK